MLLVVWGIGFAFDGLVEVAEVGKAIFVVFFVSNFDDVTPVNVATFSQFTFIVFAPFYAVSVFCLFPINVVVAGNDDDLLWC